MEQSFGLNEFLFMSEGGNGLGRFLGKWRKGVMAWDKTKCCEFLPTISAREQSLRSMADPEAGRERD